jgi:hypothetical protein
VSPWLPDGLFSNQKNSHFAGSMKDVGVFNGQLVYLAAVLMYFTVIWYIFPFWYVVPGKIWQPWRRQKKVAPIRKIYLIGGLLVVAVEVVGALLVERRNLLGPILRNRFGQNLRKKTKLKLDEILVCRNYF